MNINKNYLFFISQIKTFKWLSLAILILFNTTVFSSEMDELSKSTSINYSLGTPESFLNQIGVKEAAIALELGTLDLNSELDISRKTFSLTDSAGREIKVLAETLSIEVDGTLSMNGHALGQSNSEFILQGNNNNVYGWIILKDKNIAYEYTTKKGQLFVEKVEITKVHPICNLEQHDFTTTSAKSHLAFSSEFSAKSHFGSYPGTHVGQLESKPDSNYVIFLDTNKIMSNGVPYDVSKEFIWTTWQIVSASFSMFDVNVTTNKNVYDNAVPSKRGGATMYRQTGRSSCYFAFGTSTFCTLYRENDAYGQGRIAAHEIGHLLHLSHDGGNPGGEYYNGISDFQWVPVMGNIWMGNNWTHALYQWSKGEYNGASNREDDFSIINGFIPSKSDDIVNSKSLIVASNGNVSATDNNGQIETNTDTDKFTFSIGSSGGHISVTIDRMEHIGGGMLDVQAYIRDGNGNLIAQSNKNVNRSASFNQSLSEGDYSLDITGGAEGSPSYGFSKYSSVGYYAIAGNISGVGGGGELPSINNLSNGSTLSGTSQFFSWDVGSAESFKLSAGSSQDSENYYSSSMLNEASHTVTGLPTNGSLVHVTLHYLINGNWSKRFYSYDAASDNNNNEIGIASPLEGETLSGASQMFTWNSGDATGFWFYAGSSRGAKDYYRNASQLTGNSHEVSGLPTDGSTVYITFHYLKNGSWSQLHYTYSAFDDGGSCTSAPATPNKPSNLVVSSTSFTSNWNPVDNANSYSVQLWVSGAWKTQASPTSTTYTFTGLSANTTQYSRVSAVNNCGSSNYSEWTEVTLTNGDCTSAPSTPSGLAGNNQQIIWNAAEGATGYDVQYWTGSWRYHGSSSTTTYNLGLSGTQYVRVRASNSCGSSNYSGWITLTN